MQATPPWPTTYADENSSVLGCRHYERGCRLRAACCDGEFFTCHVCHDEKTDHTLDRFGVREMQCMHCGLIQPASKTCAAESCQKVLGRYYCAKCHLWSDNAKKNIYHCADCGICRLGRGLDIDFFHCNKCKACLAISLKNNHRCVEDVLNNNCPVCWEHLFSSRDPLSVMACGHSMHQACYESYMKNGFYRCPTCQHMLYDPSEVFLDALKQKALTWGKFIVFQLVAIVLVAVFIHRYLIGLY